MFADLQYLLTYVFAPFFYVAGAVVIFAFIAVALITYVENLL